MNGGGTPFAQVRHCAELAVVGDEVVGDVAAGRQEHLEPAVLRRSRTLNRVSPVSELPEPGQGRATVAAGDGLAVGVEHPAAHRRPSLELDRHRAHAGLDRRSRGRRSSAGSRGGPPSGIATTRSGRRRTTSGCSPWPRPGTSGTCRAGRRGSGSGPRRRTSPRSRASASARAAHPRRACPSRGQRAAPRSRPRGELDVQRLARRPRWPPSVAGPPRRRARGPRFVLARLDVKAVAAVRSARGLRDQHSARTWPRLRLGPPSARIGASGHRRAVGREHAALEVRAIAEHDDPARLRRSAARGTGSRSPPCESRIATSFLTGRFARRKTPSLFVVVVGGLAIQKYASTRTPASGLPWASTITPASSSGAASAGPVAAAS